MIDYILDYLVSIQGNKEDETVNRLFAKQIGLRIPIDDTFENYFNLETEFCLVGVRIPFDYIDESLTKKRGGDIDLFFIQLSTNTSDFLSPIEKIPTDTQITAFEVLTGYLNDKKEIKSSGLYVGKDEKNKTVSNKQLKYRTKTEKLCNLGFNKVGLLYLFPTTPKSNLASEINPWFDASDEIREIKKIINPLFYSEEIDNFTTCYRFISALPEGLEHQRGVIDNLTLVNKSLFNPIRNPDFQKKLINKINSKLPYAIHPNLLPLLLLACGNRNCKNLYLSSSNPYLRCPVCDHKPTGNYGKS